MTRMNEMLRDNEMVTLDDEEMQASGGLGWILLLEIGLGVLGKAFAQGVADGTPMPDMPAGPPPPPDM